MKTMILSRRRFLKTSGALVVGFSLFRPGQVFAQFATLPSGDIDPTQLDSWLAITPDGYVTFYTSKVEIGTGTITALAQIVAEEMDVPFEKIKMDSGDTSRTIEQGSPGGSLANGPPRPADPPAAPPPAQGITKTRRSRPRRADGKAHGRRRRG